jgi:hypothetical protein
MPTSIASAAVGSRSNVVSGPSTNCFASARRAVPNGGADRLWLQREGGGRVLCRFGRRQGEWCITYEADDPSNIVDLNVGMCPPKLQPRLRSLEKPPRFGIAHDPLTPLLLPARTGTYFTPEIDKCGAPDKSNGWHALRLHMFNRENLTATANHDAIRLSAMSGAAARIW